MLLDRKQYIQVSEFRLQKFILIDPDCLAEAAVDAHWSYEGNECNVIGFLFFWSLSAYLILSISLYE
jgi:hypothetical protein